MGNEKHTSSDFQILNFLFSVYNIYLIEARSIYLSISIA